jgi:hypothetical protein
MSSFEALIAMLIASFLNATPVTVEKCKPVWEGNKLVKEGVCAGGVKGNKKV